MQRNNDEDGETMNDEENTDRAAYILLIAALALVGVHSRGKAAEMARINYEDMHELMDKLLEMKI